MQRAREAEPQKISYFSGIEPASEVLKKSKRAQKQADKEAATTYYMDTMVVEMVDHQKASNVYMRTFAEESKSSEARSDKTHFEHLMSLDLSPEITVLPQANPGLQGRPVTPMSGIPRISNVCVHRAHTPRDCRRCTLL